MQESLQWHEDKNVSRVLALNFEGHLQAGTLL